MESPDWILQENQLKRYESRQNDVPVFTAFTLKDQRILKFSQSTALL
jgi:hypothetical protein